MTTTTEAAPSIPEVTTAQCGLCKITGHRANMTYDGREFYCGSESLDTGGQAAYLAAVTACTERWLSAGLPADPAAAHEWQASAEEAQDDPERSQEAAGDAAGEDAAPEAGGEAETAPEAEDEPAEGVNS